MKSILKTSAFIAMSAIMATSMTSCDENNGENTGELSAKEQTLKDAVTPYVKNTVIPTYKSMADIVDNITPTAEIIKIIKPVYNFKAN